MITDPYYRVECSIGAYSWTVLSTDAPGYGLADPLTVGWSCPENGPTYPQPDLMRATIRIVVADAADLADLALNDPVVLRMYGWPPGTVNPYGDGVKTYRPIVSFRGRVAAAISDPHKLGMIYTLTCVDYLADAAELDAGAVDYPAETADLRIRRITTEAQGIEIPDGLLAAPLAARPAAVDKESALIGRLLDSIAGPDPSTGFPARWFLCTRYLDGWTSDAPDHPTAGPIKLLGGTTTFDTRTGHPDIGVVSVMLPAILDITSPGLYGVVIDADDNRFARILDAALTDFVTSWALLKGSNVDLVTVGGTFAGGPQFVVEGPSAKPVRLTIDTDLTSETYAQQLGDFNIVSPDSDGWLSDGFTFYADQDPHALLFPEPLFNDAGYQAAQFYSAVLAPIQAGRNPAGPDFYAGQLTGATLTLAAGRYSVAVKMRRNLPRSNGDGALTCAALAAAGAPYSTIGCDDLDPAFSSFDYRLVRDPAYA